MASVRTQVIVEDRASRSLNAIENNANKMNQAFKATDTILDSSNPAAVYDSAANAMADAAREADHLNDKQQEVVAGAEQINGSWSKVKGYIQTAMAAIGVKKIIDLADTMTTTRARIDLMNDGLQTTDELQSMIMASANRSRAAYQTTADAISKMGIMAKDAFGSNAELIQFTELINKQFTIAGTSAAGVDAAMLQLTQAMSSGVLRGEELNSIFEQAPTIIQTIADYLGVPIGQIRAMAAEGQITSTIVKNAMLSSADEINAKFNSMPMTFANVGNIIKNSLLDAFEPAIKVIGSGAQWVYDNWERIEPVISGVAATVGILVGA